MRVPFTAALIASLCFERRPVGVDAEGQLIYPRDGDAPLPSVREWTLRDSIEPGFGIRLTQGSKSFFVQRPRGGSTSDRYRLTDQHSLRPATVYDREIALRWLRNEPLAKVPLDAVTRSPVEQTFAPMMTAAESVRAELQADPKLKRKRGGGPHTDVASAWKLLRHCAAAWSAEESPKGPMNPFAAFRKRNGKTLPKVERRTASLQTQGEVGTRWLNALLELQTDPS